MIGVRGYTQGTASMLIRYEPNLVHPATLAEIIVNECRGLGAAVIGARIPCRRVHLPVVFNDSTTQGTTREYIASTGRGKAVYLPSNIEYVARASSLDGVIGVQRAFTSCDWFVSARAFFCGLPMISPVGLTGMFCLTDDSSIEDHFLPHKSTTLRGLSPLLEHWDTPAVLLAFTQSTRLGVFNCWERH